MKNKYIKLTTIFLGTVVTAVLIYFGFNMETKQAYSMKLDHFEESFVELEAEQEILDEEMSKFFVDSEQIYIVKSLNEEKLAEIEKKIQAFDEKVADLNKDLYDLNTREQKRYTERMNEKNMNHSVENYTMKIEEIKTKRELTELINSLFSTKYIEETEIDRNVYIATDLETEKFEEVVTRTGKRIKDSAKLNIEEYSKAVKSGLEIAEKQLDVLNRAITLRDELFNANDFLVETDNEKLEEFRLAVKQIKNPEIQASFTKYLTIADAYQVEELEDELVDIENLDVDESVDQEESSYQGPSNTGSSSGSSWSGSSSGSTSGSSGSSSGGSSTGWGSESNNESSDNSNSDSNNEAPDEPNDDSSSGTDSEPSDDSNENSNNESNDESIDDSTDEDLAD